MVSKQDAFWAEWVLVQTSFCGEVGFGIWLKHHGKIWKLTRRSLKAKFQIPPLRSVMFVVNTTTPKILVSFQNCEWVFKFWVSLWVKPHDFPKHHGFSVEFGLNSEALIWRESGVNTQIEVELSLISFVLLLNYFLLRLIFSGLFSVPLIFTILCCVPPIWEQILRDIKWGLQPPL